MLNKKQNKFIILLSANEFNIDHAKEIQKYTGYMCIVVEDFNSVKVIDVSSQIC